MTCVRVKVCGITSERDLRVACEAGADAVGFVVGAPYSPRSLSVEEAGRLIRLVPLFVESVLVAAPGSLEEAVSLYRRLKPGVFQIHGTLEGQSLRERLPDAVLVRALAVSSEAVIGRAVEEARFFDALLADSYQTGRQGGTGVVHDWGVSRRIREAISPKPLVLAGGLSPENVAEAIREVGPYAVDVSTGVESRPGVKDPERIATFVRNAKGWG
jgi:phosphoribosylanthranilate isomerase